MVAIHPVQIYKEARLNAAKINPGPGSHPAEWVGWLMEQPNVFQQLDLLYSALRGVKDDAPRNQIAAACEAKLFPTANSRTGLTADKMAMLRMLQSVRGGG